MTNDTLDFCIDCHMPIADISDKLGERCTACEMLVHLQRWPGIHHNQEQQALRAAKRYERIGYVVSVNPNTRGGGYNVYGQRKVAPLMV